MNDAFRFQREKLNINSSNQRVAPEEAPETQQQNIISFNLIKPSFKFIPILNTYSLVKCVNKRWLLHKGNQDENCYCQRRI